MKKSSGVIAVLIIILIAIAIYLISREKKNREPINSAVKTNISEVAVPNVNPVSQANPFSGIKTNPFE